MLVCSFDMLMRWFSDKYLTREVTPVIELLPDAPTQLRKLGIGQSRSRAAVSFRSQPTSGRGDESRRDYPTYRFLFLRHQHTRKGLRLARMPSPARTEALAAAPVLFVHAFL